jgi:hypothetical protein
MCVCVWRTYYNEKIIIYTQTTCTCVYVHTGCVINQSIIQSINQSITYPPTHEPAANQPQQPTKQQVFNSGGAGLFLNRKALEVLGQGLNHDLNCRPHQARNKKGEGGNGVGFWGFVCLFVCLCVWCEKEWDLCLCVSVCLCLKMCAHLVPLIHDPCLFSLSLSHIHIHQHVTMA